MPKTRSREPLFIMLLKIEAFNLLNTYLMKVLTQMILICMATHLFPCTSKEFTARWFRYIPQVQESLIESLSASADKELMSILFTQRKSSKEFTPKSTTVHQ